MTLYERIEQDIKTAMKGRDTLKLSTLRMVLAAIKTAEIDKKIKALDEKDVMQILQKHAKQHRESIDQFDKGGRSDLSEKEAKELKILESYLPARLSESELLVMIKEVINSTGAATKADTGKVMKIVMEKAAGRADGKTVNQALAGLLK